MKLQQLLDYLNLLNSKEHEPDYDIVMRKFWSMAAMVSNHAVQFNSLSMDFKDSVVGVQRAFEQVDRTVESIKDHIVRMIAELEPEYYERSETTYRSGMNNEPNESIMSRELHLDHDSDILLRSHLRNLTDWRLPGMIIRPGTSGFIKDLVALDPLYLVDHNQGLLQPSMSSCTPEYQRRLRLYSINDYVDENPLWQLPTNQFGLIFAWNYFNHKPLSVIHRYLVDMFAKLRPGGVAIFSYNDCDQGHGVALAERNFMCYTPGRVIKSHATDLGFEILFEHHGEGDAAWLEIKKPGEIQSIRGGQALARVVAHQ